MEHRRGSRLPIVAHVNLETKQLHLGWFNTYDVGSGGACIDDPLDFLKKNDFLNVRINILDTARLKHYEMKAIVVYKYGSKVGLMWTNYDAEFSYLWEEISNVAA